MPDRDRPDVVGFALTYESGTFIYPHTHPAHQIIHAISGTMRVSVGGELWFLPIGFALWIPEGMEHAIRCGGRVRMRTAYLSAAYPAIFPDVRMISVTPLMREVLVRLAEGGGGALDRPLSDLLLNEIRMGSMDPFRLPIPDDPRIATLASHLQDEPSVDRTLGEWAKRLGFSERSLIRAIRAETGMTFRDLRRHSRIMAGIEKLSEGRSVTAIAFEVGFETPSAFIHAFRSVTGKTPRKFVGTS